MLHKSKQLALAAGSAAALMATGASAQVANSSAYNSPYGMTQADENQSVNPSLRDGNGNLTDVNGQFQTCAMCQESGVQQMGAFGSNGPGSTLGSSSGSSGVGVTSSSTATAIGNSLNVVTVGSNNTVVVDSTQINNGNQTATANDH